MQIVVVGMLVLATFGYAGLLAYQAAYRARRQREGAAVARARLVQWAGRR